MRCEHIQRQLSDYLDGILSAEISHQIRLHLKECPACAQEYEALRATVELVREEMPDVWVAPDEVERLEAQLWATLDGLDPFESGWRRRRASFKLRLRTLHALWFDGWDAKGWKRGFQVVLVAFMLAFTSIWVDRHYFRPSFPEMIREALMAQSHFTPPSTSEATMIPTAAQRGNDGAHLRLNDLMMQPRMADALVRPRVHPRIEPPPTNGLEGLEVRAVEFKDGKLLFVGTLEVLGAADAGSEEPALRELSVPTENPTVVMLPRSFDEPTAPSRVRRAHVFETLLEQLAYPVASPTALVIGERQESP